MRPFASGCILTKFCKFLWKNDRLSVDYFSQRNRQISLHQLILMRLRNFLRYLQV